MAPKPNSTVCGVPTSLGGPLHWEGSDTKVGIGPKGHYRSISKPGAKRLVQAIFGDNAKVPRVNTSIKLCDDQYLENVSGSFQVARNAPGELRGAPHRNTKKGCSRKRCPKRKR